MKKYLPNKTELATLVFGFGLGISMTMAIDGKLSWMMLFFWPILFIAMPLVYFIGKSQQKIDGDNSNIIGE